MAQVERRPILVIDDDEAILSSVELFLTDEDYPVATAMNGEEALDRVAGGTPSLILLDMKMPIMDGWAFATAYHARPGPHAPIVVMTAAQDTRGRAAEIAADSFIAKPFDLDHLLALVRRYAE